MKLMAAAVKYMCQPNKFETLTGPHFLVSHENSKFYHDKIEK